MIVFLLLIISAFLIILVSINIALLQLITAITADVSSILDFISKRTAMDIADDLFKSGYVLTKKEEDE